MLFISPNDQSRMDEQKTGFHVNLETKNEDAVEEQAENDLKLAKI